MAIGGIGGGNYGAAFYRTMNNATMNRNLLSGLGSSMPTSSDPMSALYSTLKDSALFKTKGYHELVKSYYTKQSDEADEQVKEATESFDVNDAEKAVRDAKNVIDNMTYNASGAVFAANVVSSGSLLNMQI